MIKTISLKVDYLDLKIKNNKDNEDALRKSLLKKSIKLFKEQMQPFIENKSINILAEYTPDEIVVEYNDDFHTEIHSAFLKAEVIDIVDSQVFNRKKSDDTQVSIVIDAKSTRDKLKKYMK